MKLKTVYLRFYKSFNFDEFRKAKDSAVPQMWEDIDGEWFPHIKVKLDDDITTIVGANESGKSHLLSGIEKAITGKNIRSSDLCRYSIFFGIEKGNSHWPSFGLGWSDLTEEEVISIQSIVTELPEKFDSFLMFRHSPNELTLYVKIDEEYSQFDLTDEQSETFTEAILPKPFRIEADIGLPDSVPIEWLAEPDESLTSVYDKDSNAKAVSMFKSIVNDYDENQTQFGQKMPQIHSRLKSYRESAEKERIDRLERELKEVCSREERLKSFE